MLGRRRHTSETSDTTEQETRGAVLELGPHMQGRLKRDGCRLTLAAQQWVSIHVVWTFAARAASKAWPALALTGRLGGARRTSVNNSHQQHD